MQVIIPAAVVTKMLHPHVASIQSSAVELPTTRWSTSLLHLLEPVLLSECDHRSLLAASPGCCGRRGM